MHRYWFQFDLAPDDRCPGGIHWGCGVTALDYNDAVHILRRAVFLNGKLPEISQVTEDIDVSTLDAGHVRPNMGDPSRRGVWFPLGYS